MLWILVVAQGAALLVLLSRLSSGRTRRPPVVPRPDGMTGTTVTVLVATLNEARRLEPCLDGLRKQGPPLAEVLVVDSSSTDGTRDLVEDAGLLDARVRLLTDDPLPPGWVGKQWALEHGLRHARGEWVLGVDADTEPADGMVAGAVAAAREGGWDVVSFSPCFAGQGNAELWLQPSLLATLVYRFGAAGTNDPAPDRVMANGQCFLARRQVLVENGGYVPARGSFCDDVTLARHLARHGVRVGFLDGSRLYKVRSYESARQMWHEWGRSLDLKDASTPARQWSDVAHLWLALGLPVPILLAWAASGQAGGTSTLAASSLAGVNAALLGVRLLLLFALRGAYERARWPFWLSPLADPLAALRITLSSMRRPTRWRSREYASA